MIGEGDAGQIAEKGLHARPVGRHRQHGSQLATRRRLDDETAARFRQSQQGFQRPRAGSMERDVFAVAVSRRQIRPQPQPEQPGPQPGHDRAQSGLGHFGPGQIGLCGFHLIFGETPGRIDQRAQTNRKQRAPGRRRGEYRISPFQGRPYFGRQNRQFPRHPRILAALSRKQHRQLRARLPQQGGRCPVNALRGNFSGQ